MHTPSSDEEEKQKKNKKKNMAESSPILCKCFNRTKD